MLCNRLGFVIGRLTRIARQYVFCVLMKQLCLFLVIIVGLSCSSRPPKEISVLSNTFTNTIIVFELDDDTITLASCKQAAAALLAGFKQVDALPSSGTQDVYVFTFLNELADGGTPPDSARLAYFGKSLTEEERQKLQHCKKIVGFEFYGSTDHVYEKEATILKFIERVTQNKHVVIMDAPSVLYFNPESWRAAKTGVFYGPVYDIVNQTAIHAYREGEYCRAITMGMVKFGLPELSIKNLPCESQASITSLINLVAQTLAEHPVIAQDSTLQIDINNIKNDSVRKQLMQGLKPNAKKNATVRLRVVPPNEGDNEGLQLMLVFEDEDGTTSFVQQKQVLCNVFGCTERASLADRGDEELEAASARARQKLPGIKLLFNKKEVGYAVSLKLPFETRDGKPEYMWIEVTNWDRGTIKGVLQNDPYDVEGLKAGSVVQVKEDDVYDYILYKPDGTQEGGETTEILLAREKEQQ